MSRYKLSRRSSRRSFSRGATRVHSKNNAVNYVMRGGIRG